MSTLQVKVVRLEISPHLQADKLEIATIGGQGGFTAVVGKGEFQNGALAIFIPEDAVVSVKIQEFLAKNKKITVNGGRIRCSRVRGIFSDGLCLVPSDWLPEKLIKEDFDATEFLGIIKYEPPPVSSRGFGLKSKGINYHYQNENFKRYTDIDNFKKYPHLFQDGEEVVATIKYHGSNFRASIVSRPKSSYTWWERTKKFFGLQIADMEFLVGSHNTIRKKAKKATQVEDTFCKMADKYDVKKAIMDLQYLYLSKWQLKNIPEVVLFGEVIGAGIQTGYDYGVPEGEYELKIFDMMVNGQYLDWEDVVLNCEILQLPLVEIVYKGPWSLDITKLSEATDEYNGRRFVREGIVIKSVKERKDPRAGRAILKYISETFRLDKTNSSNH